MNDLFRDLQRLLALSPSGNELEKTLVLAAWRRAVGEVLGRRSRALELSGTKLTVAVSDESWKQHLEGIADQMIFKINSVLRSPSVTFIEFVSRPDLFEGDGVSMVEDNSWISEIDEDLIKSAKTIEDESLREEFVRMTAKLSARRKRMGSSEPEK